ncbi:MAG: hypothetical protein QM520_04470 [Gammaproteobacteria bacterium]|nr:hypothetical protein [Gammaproteobacteria bacterium]
MNGNMIYIFDTSSVRALHPSGGIYATTEMGILMTGKQRPFPSLS